MIVITFFTHHSAQMTCNVLKRSGVVCKMAPVPRELSSSCGSCVIAETQEIDMSLCDEDTEAIYRFDSKEYIKIYSAE